MKTIPNKQKKSQTSIPKTEKKVVHQFHFLETKRSQTFMLLLHKSLIKLEDDSYRQQNTSSSTNGTHEIGNDGERTDAHTTKRGRGGDVTVQNVNEGRIAVSLHHHLVVAQLFGDITS